MKHIIIFIFLLFPGFQLRAQIIKFTSLHPPNVWIKTKYFNGYGKGYWLLEKTDSLGRVVEEKSYQKKVLTGKYLYTCNDHNDLILRVSVYDFNNPGRKDTLENKYSYRGDIITRLVWQINAITRLYELKAQHDSVLKYLQTDYADTALTRVTDSTEKYTELTYSNGLLIKKKEINGKQDSTTTQFEYFPDGRLKRRVINRDPEPALKAVYLGSPGADDQSWYYEFDKKGRVIRMYNIVNGKTYLRKTYSYRKVK
ncbi:MAG: hypothetical protein JO154_04325 [Chitinophaga sp.]|uniref:hypothetical protein n=1 Tax=Chitinophaga sp. TaxID=1869181 RepID=UPI0025BBD42B|nr:hypothetical protein [Chitinophaga sp.]MBV8251813.1 hypothetical protein [Chitinophaga sp.]